MQLTSTNNQTSHKYGIYAKENPNVFRLDEYSNMQLLIFQAPPKCGYVKESSDIFWSKGGKKSDQYLKPYNFLGNSHIVEPDPSYTFEKESFTIPSDLKEIIPILKKSEMILTLKENWDDKGGKAISKETFLAMIIFCIEYASSIYKNFDYIIDKPSIYPSLEGSIDIDWEKDNYGLLINIADGGTYASYYGDNKQKKQMVEGSFDPRRFDINLLPIAISL